MRSAKSLSLLLATAMLGCGTTPTQTNTDAGEPVPDPAYWGLADKACFRYEDGTGALLTLSAIVDTTTVGGTRTYKLLYRNNGLEQKTDWVAVNAKTLVLHRRHVPPDNSSGTFVPDKYITYAPPPDVLAQGLKTATMGGTAHTTTTTASVSSSGANTTQMVQFTLNVESTDTVHANGQDLQASQFLVTEAVTGGSQTTSKVWFVPQTGIVKLDGLGSSSFWLLKSVEQNVAPDDCVP